MLLCVGFTFDLLDTGVIQICLKFGYLLKLRD